MKKASYTHVWTSLLLPVLFACSNIDEADRFVEIEIPNINETVDTTYYKKNVLIEDFTGQSCINCPEAATIIHEMLELYGEDRVIAIGIYSGPFGSPSNARDLDLVTELGTTYWDHWFNESTPQPIGIINRTATGSKDNWKKQVNAALQDSTQLAIQADTRYDDVTRNLDIQLTLGSRSPLSGSLQILVAEDSIQAAQLLPNSQKPDRTYWHNHVLRASVNGDWGEAITMTDSLKLTRSITLQSDWRVEQIHIITFVTTEDQGVEQVITTPVATNH